MTDTYSAYVRQALTYSVLTKTEEYALAHSAMAGNQAAKDRLVNSHLRLVVGIARRYRVVHPNGAHDIDYNQLGTARANCTPLDLVQEGNLGLIHAAGNFDPDIGTRFYTWAEMWIRRYISRLLYRDTEAGIRLPYKVGLRLTRIFQAQATLTATLGRTPTRKDIAAELEMSESEVAALLKHRRSVVSTDSPIDADHTEGSTIGDMVPDPSAGAEMVFSLLDEPGLDKRALRVLRMRYGFNGDPMSQGEVAKALSVSRQKVQRIEYEALSFLKSQQAKESA